MPPLQLLIKPASSNCNMMCNYCFYIDIAQKREKFSFGFMSLDTLETLVRKSLSTADMECSFAFQGGEPTLVGIDFYLNLVNYVKQYNVKKLKVNYSIQTNALVLDEAWVSFFAQYHFLVGVSLDGNKDINDLNRVDVAGKSTYARVMRAIQLLNKHKVDYNVLAVMTKDSAKNIRKIYQFFKRNGILYQQYIPCLDPLGEERAKKKYSLTPKLYEQGLKDLFDLWYMDLCRGEYVYIRQFENWVGMLKGYHPENCSMMGRCTVQHVVEANGDIYPCDFYVIDQYKLGNILVDDFPQIDEREGNVGFVEPSCKVEDKCKKCKWYPLCRGGCRRDRDIGQEHLSLNYYCEAYQGFFEYAIERLEQLADSI